MQNCLPMDPILGLINPVEAPSINLFNPLNAELNPICHLLALLGAHHILHVHWIRVKIGINNLGYKKIISSLYVYTS